jgi:hypothetical protein
MCRNFTFFKSFANHKRSQNIARQTKWIIGEHRAQTLVGHIPLRSNCIGSLKVSVGSGDSATDCTSIGLGNAALDVLAPLFATRAASTLTIPVPPNPLSYRHGGIVGKPLQCPFCQYTLFVCLLGLCARMGQHIFFSFSKINIEISVRNINHTTYILNSIV